jgi:hypothetical protein
MTALLLEAFSFAPAQGVDITWTMGFILAPHPVGKEHETPCLPLVVRAVSE